MWLCFVFKHKTAYEMRIIDWSSDVCSSDLAARYREQEIVATGAIVCGDDFEDSLTDFGGRQHLGLAQRRRGHARAIAHDEWLAWPNVEGPPFYQPLAHRDAERTVDMTTDAASGTREAPEHPDARRDLVTMDWGFDLDDLCDIVGHQRARRFVRLGRSEEHKAELQSLMRIS